MSRLDIFLALVEAWNGGDVDAVLSLMTDTVVWHIAAAAIPPVSGKAAVRAVLEKLRSDMAETRWRILCHAESTDRLFVEGVDAYRRTNGVEVAMPYAAVVEFEGNLIASWRDYIDTRRMESLRAGDAPPDYLCALTS